MGKKKSKTKELAYFYEKTDTGGGMGGGGGPQKKKKIKKHKIEPIPDSYKTMLGKSILNGVAGISGI